MTEMDGKRLLEASYEQALTENQESMYNWVKYREDLQTTRGLVEKLPEKLSHRVLVPLGSKALFPGKIIHTNEFLVALGDKYFAKKTAKQTTEYCDRRIQECEATLTKLNTELEFLQNRMENGSKNDVFGSKERPEITEHVTEEEDKAWREQHRENVKNYHKKLAKLRETERKIENEEDLWDRLEQLELEEELEDELNRLYDEEDSESEDSREEVTKKPRKINFSDGIIRNPLILRFRHSKTEPIRHSKHLTPADIHVKPATKSILKVKINPNEKTERSRFEDEKPQKNVQPIKNTTFLISDVIERNPKDPSPVLSTKKRVSKFQQSRLKE